MSLDWRVPPTRDESGPSDPRGVDGVVLSSVEEGVGTVDRDPVLPLSSWSYPFPVPTRNEGSQRLDEQTRPLNP